MVNVPGGERPVQRILDMHDIKTSNVLLPMHNNTCPAHITTPSDDDDISSVEFDVVGDLPLLEVEFDRVIDLD